ncbi:MAG: AGE family epimerase/isomerase [Rhodospirillales bacterium]|nr:AGE family epimerase/isomerase [Alphaproteobacteria bacterium]USO04444.1 MAG: AGE family epimerase/isomerase [Rhodospirillales bacterium]
MNGFTEKNAGYAALEALYDEALHVWVPAWFKDFSAPQGGFYERLGADGRPLDVPRRLLTQCRQIIVYAQAYTDSGRGDYLEKITEGYAHLVSRYRGDKTGGFRFSLNADGSLCDGRYDLYGHAFFLLAAACYYKATRDGRALEDAARTLEFITRHFRYADHAGFAEGLEGNTLEVLSGPRRQNPHMHLLEGCLYMFEVSGDERYKAVADEMVDLFYGRFLDPATQTIGEFFEADLSPSGEKGHLVEAGHHAEWIWLLKKYQDVTGEREERHLRTMKSLFDFVFERGTDKKYGGIFNAQRRDGQPEDTGKRIWPVLETLRAASVMSGVDGYRERAEETLSGMIGLLRKNYIDAGGRWTESLNRDLSANGNERPGTTPYHIFPAIRDAEALVKFRQSGKGMKEVHNYT